MISKLPPFYKDPFLSLWIGIEKNVTNIVMQVPDLLSTTATTPDAIPILEHALPTIFEGTCFNGKNLPFLEEAKNTETGHLFEHILLEYLFTNNSKKTYRGLTMWNASTLPHGYFEIYVNEGIKNEDSILDSATKSIHLLKQIFVASESHMREHMAHQDAEILRSTLSVL